MNRQALLKGLLIVIALAIVFYTQIHLGSAVLFGDDEGCELMKAVMCNQGYALYTDIWNDQPPILTLLLATAFKFFGTSLIVGRLIAASFGLLLFGSFYWLVAQRLGQWKAILAFFLLIAAPDVALLSASVMLEVPAFATAMLATCFLFQWKKTSKVGWLIASGVIMGIALQIKLTAIVVAPAMLFEIAIGSNAILGRSKWKTISVDILKWGGTVTLTVLTIVAIWARGSVVSSLKSHFGEHPQMGMIGPQDYPFQTALLWNHMECILAALVGVIWVAKNNQWRQLSVPIIFLLTVSCIHAVHRPFWGYYYLHFAIPLAWLSAVVVSEAIVIGERFLSTSHYRPASMKTWQGVALLTVAAFVLVRSERRLEASNKGLRESQTVANDPVIAKMKEYASHTHWVYADQDIYPFHVGLNIPPGLTVVVLKRFWSGQISENEIVETCKRYQVEQILLDPAKTAEEWRDMLSNYEIAYQNTNVVLYVAKSIK